MGDLAKNHALAQCLFTGMIGRRHRLIVEKQQQMLLNSQVVPEKLLSLKGTGASDSRSPTGCLGIESRIAEALRQPGSVVVGSRQ